MLFYLIGLIALAIVIVAFMIFAAVRVRTASRELSATAQRGKMTCPQCLSPTVRLLSTKIIDKKNSIGLVAQQSTAATDSAFAAAPAVNIPWQPQVPLIRTTFATDYECTECHAKWSTTKVIEVENRAAGRP